MATTDEIDATVLHLKQLLDAEREKAQTLLQRVETAEKQASAAEALAVGAGLDAQAVQERLAALQTLKRKEYQQVITELFEVPSRHATKVTIRAAVWSIMISLAVAITQGLYSTKQAVQNAAAESTRTSQLLTNLDATLSEIRGSEDRTRNRLIRLAAIDPRVQQIAKRLRELSSAFNDYRDINDVALAYKLRLASETPPTPYEFYLAAFREAGIRDAALPKDGAAIGGWDAEVSTIYRGMIKSGQATVGPIDERLRRFETHKDNTDTTRYDGWRFQTGTTGAALVASAEPELQKVQRQVEYNRLDTYPVGAAVQQPSLPTRKPRR